MDMLWIAGINYLIGLGCIRKLSYKTRYKGVI